MSREYEPTKSLAGTFEGRAVHRFTLNNDQGMSVEILEFGAILQSVRVPDAHGHIENVALGFKELDEYVVDHSFFGAIVGRCANRLEDGKFSIDGHQYQATVNDPPNSVHGGMSGFNRKIWVGTPFATGNSTGVRMQYTSPAGEEGFPGTLETAVVYELLLGENILRASYSATTDEPTIVNLTNHSFFNLEGEGNGTILDHVVTINADHYLPLSPTLLPTGEIRSVTSTPMDFRRPHTIGERSADTEDFALVGGYDHNYVLGSETKELVHAVGLVAPVSGRRLDVWTTEPAIDFYTGNYFDGSIKGARGLPYVKWAGVAIEPEHVSNSPKMPSFPTTVLRPGDTYLSTTEWRFGIGHDLY